MKQSEGQRRLQGAATAAQKLSLHARIDKAFHYLRDDVNGGNGHEIIPMPTNKWQADLLRIAGEHWDDGLTGEGIELAGLAMLRVRDEWSYRAAITATCWWDDDMLDEAVRAVARQVSKRTVRTRMRCPAARQGKR